jgi:hypothetical protein
MIRPQPPGRGILAQPFKRLANARLIRPWSTLVERMERYTLPMSPAPTPESIVSALRDAGIETPPISIVVERPAHPLFGFEVASDEAIDTWRRLRSAASRTGLYPVLIADDHAILQETEGFPSPAEALAEAGRIDIARWLKIQIAEAMEHAEPGEWPDDVEPVTEFGAPFDILSGEPRTDLLIVLLPTNKPWEAAAYLQFAAVNYDIEPHHHVAVHKLWHEQFGAELVACGGDFLELQVSRPPTTREAALELAKVHYGYCPDIVDQGAESLEALAAMLLNSTVWFFWWD